MKTRRRAGGTADAEVMLGLGTAIRWRVTALLKPPISLGVRLIVRDPLDQVLLVRHTYMKGLHLPGGGVDVGETAQEAAVRECFEETNLAVDSDLRLVGLYFNRHHSNRDHVATFVADLDHPFDEAELKPQAIEISHVVVARIKDLPAETTGPTRRRLAELKNGTPSAIDW